MMNWFLFPPQTNEVQFDEKWSFVGKKDKNCDPFDPNDEKYGDNWDHIAFDPEHRLVISVIPGKRTAENIHKLIEDFIKRTRGKLMRLITTDKYMPYKEAIRIGYGRLVNPERTGKRGRPKKPYWEVPSGLIYAMVKKTLSRGRISKVETELVFGTEEELKRALKRSKVSKKVNTSFIERQNGTDRSRNSRKIRKSLSFSKEPEEHEAMTFFCLYSYNFCWPIRTLQIQEVQRGHSIKRTPAMAAGLTDHVWTIEEWIRFPAVQLC